MDTNIINQQKSLNEIFRAEFRDSDCRDILDAMTTLGVYVVEADTHRILFYNRNIKDTSPNIELGMICDELWAGNCSHCPLKVIGDKATVHTESFFAPLGIDLDIVATRMMWKGTTPAFVIRVLPKNERFAFASDGDDEENFASEIYTDPLTGGRNREGFIKAMEDMKLCGMDMTEYAILYANISGFKAINETFGSEAGDCLLRALYFKFVNSPLDPAVGSRKGSDHFGFLVKKSNIDDEVLRSLLEFKWVRNGQELVMRIKCGIYDIIDDTIPFATMMGRAKLAKEKITDEYISPYKFYDESMKDDYIEQMEILTSFDSALAEEEFKVYYQPVVDARTGKPVAAEALVRWVSPTNGFISPAQFIPILEQFGYITRLDEYVAWKVAAFLHSRHDVGEKILPISINFSRMDFFDEGGKARLLAGLENSTLPKGTLRFEITETSNSAIEDKQFEFIDEIHKRGGFVYLDDFGVGSSTFEMFKNCNFDALKIDRGITRELTTSNKVQVIAKTLIDMCHELDIKVVAEGVETEEELEMLKGLGCKFIQGYYYSKPLSQEDFIKYIDENL